MGDRTFRYLSGADVRKSLPMERAITVMKDAFVQLSGREANVPVRTRMDLPDRHGRALLMPAYLPRQGQFGVKLVSLFDDNPSRKLPFIHAVMILFDAVDGHPVAVMDAEQLTALRTGATSGLATDLLARRSASVAVIIGAGKQGATQLEGICAVRPIAVAYVIDNDAKKAASFAETMTAALAVRVIPAGKTDVLREADIICTATTSTAPLFSHDIIKAGAHINAIGAFRPDMQEVPPETVRSAKVIVDHLASCLEEAGDLIQPIRNGVITRGHLYAELGQIVSGEKRGRVSEDEITLFKSVGNAVQDLAAAGAAVAHASEHQLGAEIPF